jgi:hypothetical protein
MMKKIILLMAIFALVLCGSALAANYTVIVDGADLTNFNLTANYTGTGEVALVAGIQNITTDQVLVRLKSDGMLLARYTLNESLVLNLTDADYEYMLINYSGNLTGNTSGDSFVDDSDYTQMIKKERFYPSNASYISICNEKGINLSSNVCTYIDNVFVFNESEINATTVKTQNGKTITAERVGDKIIVSGDLDPGDKYFDDIPKEEGVYERGAWTVTVTHKDCLQCCQNNGFPDGYCTQNCPVGPSTETNPYEQIDECGEEKCENDPGPPPEIYYCCCYTYGYGEGEGEVPEFSSAYSVIGLIVIALVVFLFLKKRKITKVEKQ